MPQSQPSAVNLLQAVRLFIDEQISPGLSSYQRYHARIASNLLAIVQREIELGPEQNLADAARLAALLGHDGPIPDLNAELAERIRSGAIGIDRQDLRDHLLQTMRDGLAVNNPKWLEQPVRKEA
jgi:hypothetical protein